MKVFIVDDERPARERLKQLLSQLPEVTLCGEAADGVEALRRIQVVQPDLVLLDVRIPKMSGLEVAHHLAQLETPPALIFSTAYDEYAIDAIDSKAAAYLLKPVRLSHLQKALSNARALNRAQLANMRRALGGAGSPGVDSASAEPTPARTHLCTRLGNRLELIAVSDVIYFQAEQKYVTVRHISGEAVLEESLKSLEEEFSDQVLRIHRNALVGLAHVAGMEKTPHGRYQVVFRDLDERLEVSRRLVAGVRKAIRGL